MTKFAFYCLAILPLLSCLTVKFLAVGDPSDESVISDERGNSPTSSDIAVQRQVASTDGVAKQKTSEPKRLINASVDKERLRDKLKGMLLLGAYGDALGVPHELGGGALYGRIGQPEIAEALQPFAVYRVDTAGAWGIWATPARDKIGLPTDDTCYRFGILHQWMNDLSTQKTIPTLNEKQFLSWLDQQAPVSEGAPQWTKIRLDFVQDLVKAINGAKRGKIVEPFYFPGDPVVFGPFLYLELASIYAGRSQTEVFETFNDFSVLDQQYGKFVTGMMSAMLAKGIGASPENERRFDRWFFETADKVLKSNLGDAQYRGFVREHFNAGKQIGIQNRDLDMKAFLQVLNRQVFLRPPPNDKHRTPNYEPLLIIRMIAAAVGYSDGSIKRALQVLAVAPGDSDTMASQLGSIVGAYCGEKKLRRPTVDLSADLTRVSDCVITEFGWDISEISDVLLRCQALLEANRKRESSDSSTSVTPNRSLK